MAPHTFGQLKLLLVMSAFHPVEGGAENQMLMQSVELSRRGHSVDVVTWRREPGHLALEVTNGVTIHRVPLRQGLLGRLVSSIEITVKIAARLAAADIVLVRNVNAPGHMASFLSWVLRKPCIAIMAASPRMPGTELNHAATPGLQGATRRSAVRLLLRRATIVAMTQEIEEGVRAIGRAQVTRIPNAVDEPPLTEAPRTRAELANEIGLGVNSKLVVAAGRMMPVKRFDQTLRAWKLTRGRRTGARLVLIGSGRERPQLESLAAELGVTPTVDFLSPGARRTRRYIEAADLLVISSAFEGMSNVLLEAMVAGVPVISTPVSGSTDLIRNGDNGIIVPHGDPEALARAIDRVLEDPGQMGSRGRATVLATCMLPVVVDQLETLIRAAVLHSTPPSISGRSHPTPTVRRDE